MRTAAALFLALLAGCGRADPPGLQRVDSNAGTYAVTVQTRPAPVPLNAPFDLLVTVATKDGAPAPDLALEVDARMPEHFHGMNTAPRVVREADGRFRAEGLLFHMPGLWELHLDLSRGGRTERAQLDLVLK